MTRGRFETSIDEDGKTRLRDRYVVSAPLAGAAVAHHAARGRSPWRPATSVADADAGAVAAARRAHPARSERACESRGGQRDSAPARASSVPGCRSAAGAAASCGAREKLAREGFVSHGAAGERPVGARWPRAASSKRHRRPARWSCTNSRRPRRVQPAATGAATGQPLSVRAPVAGVVLRVALQSEATVARGTPLLDIGDTLRMEVVAELLTTDARATRSPARAR